MYRGEAFSEFRSGADHSTRAIVETISWHLRRSDSSKSNRSKRKLGEDAKPLD